MSTRITSLAAYRDQRDTGALTRTRREVYDVLATHGAMTGAELDARLTATGGRGHFHKRLPELRDAGYVEERGQRVCTVTGKRAIVWGLATGRAVADDPTRRPGARCLWCSLPGERLTETVGETCADCGAVVTEVSHGPPPYGRVIVQEGGRR